MTRFTVVGAVLIVAMALLALFTIKALSERSSGEQRKSDQ